MRSLLSRRGACLKGNRRFRRKLARKLTLQPGLSQPEIVPDGVYRLVQCFRRFLRCYTAEITHFDELAQMSVFCTQCLKSPMDIEHLEFMPPVVGLHLKAGVPSDAFSPSRLALAAARAESIRICRITRLASAKQCARP